MVWTTSGTSLDEVGVCLGVWCTGSWPKVAIFFLILGSREVGGGVGVLGGVGGGVAGGVSGVVSLGVSTTGGRPKVTIGLALTVGAVGVVTGAWGCLLYTSPSPRDLSTSRMPSSA